MLGYRISVLAGFNDDGKDGSILASIVGIDRSSIICNDRHIAQSSSWHRNCFYNNHTAICLHTVGRVAAAHEGGLDVVRASCPPL